MFVTQKKELENIKASIEIAKQECKQKESDRDFWKKQCDSLREECNTITNDINTIISFFSLHNEYHYEQFYLKFLHEF